MGKWMTYLKITINFIVYILIFLFCIFALPRLIRFFGPFVIGWIISIIANPLVKFLEKKVKIIRKHSSAIIIITVIIGVAAAFYALIALLVRELISLSNDIPNIYLNIQTEFTRLSERLSGVYDMLPDQVKITLDNIQLDISEYVKSMMTDDRVSSTATSVVKNVAELLVYVIITILSAYFFIGERENILKETKKLMPSTIVEYYQLIAHNFKTAFGGYFKAQFKIMLIIIIILFIGFEILQVDYSFLLAMGIALLDFLPFFGTGFVLWPWAIIDLLLGNYYRAIALVAIYIICQLLKQILQPKMVGDSIGVSPLTTLILMYIGYQFMGVFGMIIGIPIGLVLIKFYKIGMFNTLIRGLKIIVHDINEFRKF